MQLTLLLTIIYWLGGHQSKPEEKSLSYWLRARDSDSDCSGPPATFCNFDNHHHRLQDDNHVYKHNIIAITTVHVCERHPLA